MFIKLININKDTYNKYIKYMLIKYLIVVLTQNNFLRYSALIQWILWDFTAGFIFLYFILMKIILIWIYFNSTAESAQALFTAQKSPISLVVFPTWLDAFNPFIWFIFYYFIWTLCCSSPRRALKFPFFLIFYKFPISPPRVAVPCCHSPLAPQKKNFQPIIYKISPNPAFNP